MHILYFACFCYVVVQPKSTSVLLGETATFSCAGDGLQIIWTINDVNAIDLGFEPTTIVVADIRMSNLTITGSVKTTMLLSSASLLF